MKLYNNLFDTICTYENIKIAYSNAIKGKKHYKEVKQIETCREEYLQNLLNEIKNETYEVSPYEEFSRYTGGKVREIAKLPMKDRIVQHLLMLYLEPIFRENFIIDTYASIKGRGIHIGLKRVKKALKKYKYKYYLKLDIRKCYQSLDKEILKDKLRQKFKDEKLLKLLYKIIDSYHKGIPIGNYTSQYFNNFYFSEFDHWIKEIKRIKGYFRYRDDMIILSSSKEKLHNLFKEISVKISELNVQLKPNYQIYDIEKQGINFLGYIIYPNHIKIRKQIKNNFKKKISKLDFKKERDFNVLGSYYGICSHADCRNLWKKYVNIERKEGKFYSRSKDI